MTDFTGTFKRREIVIFAKGIAGVYISAEYEGVINGGETETEVVCQLAEELVHMILQKLDLANDVGTTFDFPHFSFNLSKMSNEEFIEHHRRIFIEMIDSLIHHHDFQKKCIDAFESMIGEQYS